MSNRFRIICLILFLICSTQIIYFYLKEPGFQKRKILVQHSSNSTQTEERSLQFLNRSISLEEPTKCIYSKSNTVICDTSEKIVQLEQNKRVEYLKRKCVQQPKPLFDLSETTEPPNSNSTIAFTNILTSNQYFCNKRYGFCICIVPKSGSTFWTQTFQVLDRREYTFDSIFIKPRRYVHKLGFKYKENFEDVIRENRKTILITRDPYSRLYSAFIDKVYLPNREHTFADFVLARSKGVSIRKFDSCAGINATFQDFLNYVIWHAEKVPTLKHLDKHWQPVSVLCNPCLVNTVAIVKQETFTEDVKYSLKVLEIESKEYNFLTDALENRSSDIIISELVKNFQWSSGKTKKRSCFGSVEIAARLWHAFQIQGYINTMTKFPLQTKDAASLGEMKSNYLIDLIVKTRKKYPMTSEMMRMQRRKCLIDAYKVIDRSTIKKLQKLYKRDFELYDYDPTPPGD